MAGSSESVSGVYPCHCVQAATFKFAAIVTKRVTSGTRAANNHANTPPPL
ncbi:hypothetical protein [Thiospirillum jenense]|nr:hypothetical protein [Thiospirillum jenense]